MSLKKIKLIPKIGWFTIFLTGVRGKCQIKQFRVKSIRVTWSHFHLYSSALLPWSNIEWLRLKRIFPVQLISSNTQDPWHCKLYTKHNLTLTFSPVQLLVKWFSKQFCCHPEIGLVPNEISVRIRPTCDRTRTVKFIEWSNPGKKQTFKLVW